MKFYLYTFVILGLSGISSAAKAGVVPEGYPVERYSALWQRSPFTIASIQQEAVPAGFASKLALVAVAKIGSEDMAILLDKDSQERINVDSGINGKGLKLVSVEPNPDPLKASVTIQKGAEVAKVKYDPSLLAAAGVPPPNNANPVPGQIPPPIPGQAVSPPLPPVSRVRRTLPIPSPYQAPPVTNVPAPAVPPPQ